MQFNKLFFVNKSFLDRGRKRGIAWVVLLLPTLDITNKII